MVEAKLEIGVGNESKPGAHYFVIDHRCTFCENRATLKRDGVERSEDPVMRIDGEEYQTPLCEHHRQLVSSGFRV